MNEDRNIGIYKKAVKDMFLDELIRVQDIAHLSLEGRRYLFSAVIKKKHAEIFERTPEVFLNDLTWDKYDGKVMLRYMKGKQVKPYFYFFQCDISILKEPGKVIITSATGGKRNWIYNLWMKIFKDKNHGNNN